MTAFRSRFNLLIDGLFGPGVLLVRFIVAQWVLNVFAASADPEKAMPSEGASKWAESSSKWLRAHAPTLQASPQAGYTFLFSGSLWALVLYLLLVHHAFAHLQQELLDGGSPHEVSAFAGELARPASTAMAEAVLRASGIEDSDDATRRSLANAIDNNLKADNGNWRLPALPTALDIALNNHRCARQDLDCRSRLLQSIERLLIGYSPRWTNYDVHYIAFALDCTRGNDAKEPKPPGQADRFWEAITFQRSTPLDAAQVSALILGKTVPAKDDPQPKIVQHLLQSALDHDGARHALTYEVGVFFGWERLVVFVLFLCTANAMMYRQCARTPLEEQALFLHKELRKANRDRDKDFADKESTDKAWCQSLVSKLGKDFDGKFADLRQAQDGSKDDRQDASTADPQLHPIAGLLSAARRSCEVGGHFVEAAEADATGHMSRWRETVNGFITLFPVIGFSATLLGLIAAFASADRVAMFTGVEKTAAVRAMVSDLSSCFATTFMALLCMAILTLFSLRQGHREQSLVSRLSNDLRATLGLF